MMKVFWPTDGVERSHGSVVGWRVEDTLCVVGIVEDWLANRVSANPELMGASVRPIEVLAQARPSQDSEPSLDGAPTFWLNETYIPLTSSIPVQVILYEPPDHSRLRFLTIRPDAKSQYDEHLAKQDAYSVCSRSLENSSGGSGNLGQIDTVVSLLNSVRKVQLQLKGITAIQSSQRFTTRSVLDSTLWDTISVMRFALLPLQVLSDFILSSISYSPHPMIGSLGERSAFLRQVSLRLEQLKQGPEQFRTARRDGLDMQARSATYMRLWNTVWLVINDLILGYCARQVILQSAKSIAPILAPTFQTYLVDNVVLALRWLNDWPVGLKLNTPLSQFICTSSSLIVQFWGDTIGPVIDHASLTLFIFIFLASLSLGGLTCLLAASQDIIHILTFHLSICDIIMKNIFRWQLGSLGALWNLFRGKRWNVLRQRIDSYAYDVDHLFLGTLLFTVSAFLFPTVLTYASLFALLTVIIATCTRAIQLCVNALNAFPLFGLMLLAKEPSRLPAGVELQLRELKQTKRGVEVSKIPGIRISHVFELKSSPKSLADISQSSEPM